MERGYIKLWRSIDQNELLENDNTAFVVFLKLLTRVDRHSGTYTTGRFKLAALCNLNPSTLYSALKRLEASSVIQQHSNKKSTTISICNWWKYQQDDNQTKNERPTSNITKQEKKEKEVNTSQSSDELRQLHEQICKLFQKNPNAYKLSEKRKQTLRRRIGDVGKEGILKACEAITHSNHHMGENDRGWVAEPYWCLESYEKAEKWMNNYNEAHNYEDDLTKMEINI